MYFAEVLSNESFKHNKLKRHLEPKYGGLFNKERNYFEREQKLKRQGLHDPTNALVIRVQQATLASYLVVWRIARAKKAHYIGEELVKPAALDIYGNEFAKKRENVLSNDTVHTRN